MFSKLFQRQELKRHRCKNKNVLLKIYITIWRSPQARSSWFSHVLTSLLLRAQKRPSSIAIPHAVVTPSSLATHHHSRPRADKTDFPAASTDKRTSENSWSGLVFTVGLETILYNWRILHFFEWSKRFQTWSSLKESSVAGSAMDWFGHVSIWSSSSSNGFRPTCSASSRERYSSEDSDMMLQMSFTKSCSARRFSSTPWKRQIIQRMNNLLWNIIGEHLGNGCIQQPLVDTPFVFHMNLVSWKGYIFLKMNLVQRRSEEFWRPGRRLSFGAPLPGDPHSNAPRPPKKICNSPKFAKSLKLFTKFSYIKTNKIFSWAIFSSGDHIFGRSYLFFVNGGAKTSINNDFFLETD